MRLVLSNEDVNTLVCHLYDAMSEVEEDIEDAVKVGASQDVLDAYNSELESIRKMMSFFTLAQSKFESVEMISTYNQAV